MAASTPSLKTLLGDWRKLLTDWAASGQLTAAAQDALQLSGEPKLLKQLVKQWSNGDFSALPPIVLLPSSSMPGAAGAYAISTGTIYLNQDWLQTASHDWVMAVLTEELGHHLDGMLNTVDTPGDEGEAFARLLTKYSSPFLASKPDSGTLIVNDIGLSVEMAETPTLPSILAWNNLIDSGGADYSSSVAVAGNGDVYTGGWTSSALYGSGFSGGGLDGYIIKYNSNGTRIWTRLIGSSGLDRVTSLSAAVDFGVLACGQSDGNLNGGLNNGGTGDAFIARYSADGSLAWSKIFGTSAEDAASSIVAAPDGSIYTTGFTAGNLDGLANASNPGFSDAFLTKTNANGTSEWTKLIGGVSDDRAKAVSVSSSGSIYVVGDTRGAFDGQVSNNSVFGVNPNNDVFIASFSSSGIKQWTRLISGNSNDVASGVTTSSDGSIYVVGSTLGGDGINDLPISSSPFGFLAKYNPDGTRAWISFMKAGSTDVRPSSVCIGQDGKIHVNGSLLGYGLYFDGQAKTSYDVDTFLASFEPSGIWIGGISIGTPLINDWGSGIAHAPGNGVYISQSIDGTNVADASLSRYSSISDILLNSVTVVEGSAASTVANLTVTLSAASTQNVTVQYATIDGTAKAGTDYTATTGTLTIAAGQTSGTISIPILNDNVNEANESFTVQLSNPVNATLSATSATVTISDTLTSAVTAVLPAGVENLTLTGSALANGTGNAGPNVLTGNSAANTLAGLAGNDTYRFVANTQLGSDTVTEAASAGTDSINLASTTTAVRLNLGITTVQTVNANLKLTITTTNTIENAVGGNSDDVLTGNALANALTGGTGADRLSGLAGNDLLDGGLGNDLLTGGVGLDRFRFASGAAFATTIGNDAIYEFISGEDKIELSKKTFTAITTAAGSPLTSFTTVDDDSLVDSSASVIAYSSSSGGLFYNMNGATTGDATKVFEFASLGNVPATLLAADFTVIA